MATKRLKAMTRTLVDSVRKFLRQPTSDQSNEVPAAKEVARAKSVAASPGAKSRSGPGGSKKAGSAAGRSKRRGRKR